MKLLRAIRRCKCEYSLKPWLHVATPGHTNAMTYPGSTLVDRENIYRRHPLVVLERSLLEVFLYLAIAGCGRAQCVLALNNDLTILTYIHTKNL